MKRRIAFVAGILSLSSMMYAQTSATSSGSASADAIHNYLEPLVANQTLAGAVTLISSKEATSYLQAVGYRDRAAKTPMGKDCNRADDAGGRGQSQRGRPRRKISAGV
jgi:hypothetical protein